VILRRIVSLRKHLISNTKCGKKCYRIHVS